MMSYEHHLSGCHILQVLNNGPARLNMVTNCSMQLPAPFMGGNAICAAPKDKEQQLNKYKLIFFNTFKQLQKYWLLKEGVSMQSQHTTQNIIVLSKEMVKNE